MREYNVLCCLDASPTAVHLFTGKFINMHLHNNTETTDAYVTGVVALKSCIMKQQRA